MKKILLFIILISNIYAGDIFEFTVNNPTTAKVYYNIFNGMSSMFANDTYILMLNIMFLIGGFTVFVMVVLKAGNGEDRPQETLGSYAKYIIAATMLLMIVFGGEDRDVLSIESRELPTYLCGDPTNDSYSAYTVSLPGILPEMFSLFNQLGVASTDLAASVFSNISSDTNVNNSFLRNAKTEFGKETTVAIKILSNNLGNLRITSEILNEDINSTTFGSAPFSAVLKNMDNFYNECFILVPNSDIRIRVSNGLNQTSLIFNTMNDILNTDKINVYAIDNRLLYTDDLNTSSIKPSELLINFNNTTGSCKDYFNDFIVSMYNLMNQQNYICSIPSLKKITPSDMYTLTNNPSLSNLGGLSQLAINSAMINSYSESKSSSKIVNQMNYAAGKSMAELALNEVGSGYYMAEMLPLLESAIKSILYAFFPFVFLSMILPGGYSVIKSYFQSVLWVELWAPVAAVLNMFLNYFAIDNMQADMAKNGISTVSQSLIVNDSTMLGGVAGYLYASIPALTFMLVSGSSVMMHGFLSKLSSIYAKNIDSDSIRKDIQSAKTAESISKKTGENIGIAKSKLNESLAQAEIHAISQSTAYNSGKGYKNYWSDIGESNAQKEAEKSGRGSLITNESKKLAEIAGSYEQNKENKFNQYLSEMNNSSVDNMASAVASSLLSLDKQELKEMNAINNFTNNNNNMKYAENISTINSYSTIKNNMTQLKTVDSYTSSSGFPNNDLFSNFVNTAKDFSTTNSQKSYADYIKTKTFIEKSTNGDTSSFNLMQLGRLQGYKESINIDTFKMTKDIMGEKDLINDTAMNKIMKYSSVEGTIEAYKNVSNDASYNLNIGQSFREQSSNLSEYKELNKSWKLSVDHLSQEDRYTSNVAEIKALNTLKENVKLNVEQEMAQKYVYGMRNTDKLNATKHFQDINTKANIIETYTEAEAKISFAESGSQDYQIITGSESNLQKMKNVESFSIGKRVGETEMLTSLYKESFDKKTLGDYTEAGEFYGTIGGYMEIAGTLMHMGMITGMTPKNIKNKLEEKEKRKKEKRKRKEERKKKIEKEKIKNRRWKSRGGNKFSLKFAQAKKEFYKTLDNINGKATDFNGKIISGKDLVKNKAGQIIISGAQGIENAKNSIKNIPNMPGKLINSIKGGGYSLLNSSEYLTDNVKDIAAKGINSVKSMPANLANKAVGSIVNTSNIVKNSYHRGRGAITGSIKSAGESIKNTGRHAVSAYNMVKNPSDTIKNFNKSIGNYAKEMYRSTPKDFQHFVSNIKNNPKEALNMAKSFGKEVIKHPVKYGAKAMSTGLKVGVEVAKGVVYNAMVIANEYASSTLEKGSYAQVASNLVADSFKVAGVFIDSAVASVEFSYYKAEEALTGSISDKEAYYDSINRASNTWNRLEKIGNDAVVSLYDITNSDSTVGVTMDNKSGNMIYYDKETKAVLSVKDMNGDYVTLSKNDKTLQDLSNKGMDIDDNALR